MRLIDADALLEKKRELELYFAVLERDIENAPTIDAEVVTRCKDCAYYERGECDCPYILTSDGAHIYTYENDFCSYAEPKAREDN